MVAEFADADLWCAHAPTVSPVRHQAKVAQARVSDATTVATRTRSGQPTYIGTTAGIAWLAASGDDRQAATRLRAKPMSAELLLSSWGRQLKGRRATGRPCLLTGQSLLEWSQNGHKRPDTARHRARRCATRDPHNPWSEGVCGTERDRLRAPGAASKAGRGSHLSRVRIPLPPPASQGPEAAPSGAASRGVRGRRRSARCRLAASRLVGSGPEPDPGPTRDRGADRSRGPMRTARS